ncbi:hypothetical protein B9Z65_8365 [Elsinoe australis]|uniref:Ergosterol biosynthetic protein 28 n=1 Tax=Elsinoe australis TaxID=40998 RepID=A0A2P7YDJ1_9PEZI|nr:hypothetical protein B9Z65_8365 [Elsinoe australis]
MSSLTSYLPPASGLLPKWLLFISVVSLANSIQAYSSLSATRRVYAGPAKATTANKPKVETSPVTPLSARTFGTWTAITAIVRLYAAYNVNDKAWFEIAMWTFAVAWGHFVSEWLVFGTVRLNAGSAGPLCVATGSLTWMSLQKGYYVK